MYAVNKRRIRVVCILVISAKSQDLTIRSKSTEEQITETGLNDFQDETHINGAWRLRHPCEPG